MMKFDRFTELAQDAAARAYEIMQRYGHSQLDTEHLLLALLEQPDGVIPQILDRLGVNVELVKERLDEALRAAPKVLMPNLGQVGQVYITPRVKHVFDLANEEANRLEDEYISTEHIFLAIVSAREGASSRILNDLGVTSPRVIEAVGEVRGGQRVTSPQAESRYRTLEKYSRDLTQEAHEGKIDPVVGRDAEILRVMRILSRRTKNNPVLIGEAGVGKTAIVEGLALRIAADDVPELLVGRHIVSLNLGSMVAGTRFRGEFEERLRAALEEIERAEGEIILFIDELHTVVGAGGAQGAIDASNMMKPALARGELRCIGATTLDEYRKYIEQDSALERRFSPIYVEEPSIDETIHMIEGLRDRYEAHHQVVIKDEAIEAAARLSDRYIKDRRLPDKAVDLVDEAAAKLRIAIFSLPNELREKKGELQRLITEEEAAWAARDYERAATYKTRRAKVEAEFNQARDAWQQEKGLEEVVHERDIMEVVSSWTGIPLNNMLETEAHKLLHMENTLHERIVGQDEAIDAVADAIRRARSGLKDPRRPIGSFIFLGPSGVGKTELAKALAWFMFDSDDALLRIDMSEYREQHSTSRLFGAPPGYVGYDEGGQLTEAVRRRPYQVILFDEIEKAHPEVWNSLLQILEDGRLTDGQGHVVDFRNTVIIMTSNVGTQFGKRGASLGFRTGGAADIETFLSGDMDEELKKTFRPEFLNRIDEMIIFHALDEEQVKAIVDLQMVEIKDRLAAFGARITLTEEGRVWLAKTGFDAEFGARPLRRTLQREVESPLAKRLLGGELAAGTEIKVVVRDDKLAFDIAQATQEAIPEPVPVES